MNKTNCRCFFDERWAVKRHIAGLTSIYSCVNILIGMNELRCASGLVTFDASTCEASLNAIENINTYEKSKMPRGIERKNCLIIVSTR